MHPHVSPFAATCAILLLLLPLARAQEDRLVTTPPLEQAFPLEVKFGDVKLKFPVLLDSRTILGPDAVLHSIYIDPNAGMRARGGGGGGNSGGGGMGGRHHHSADADGGGDSGDTPPSPQAPDAAASPAGLAPSSAKKLPTEDWHDVDTFQQALAGANDLGTMIVYAQPGEKKSRSTMLDLPDGMLLAEVSGHVQVLALSADSRAGAAGLQPGDQLELVGGKPIASLHDFTAIYFPTAEQARKEGKPYSFQVARPGEAAPVTIQVGAPPSLMHMF